jgi:hypothetical protein
MALKTPDEAHIHQHFSDTDVLLARGVTVGPDHLGRLVLAGHCACPFEDL